MNDELFLDASQTSSSDSDFNEPIQPHLPGDTSSETSDDTSLDDDCSGDE